ncbi:MAG TPA: lipoprotein [Accumulibacter sp.]|uniref:LPS translocon maturation chaperone LptM n=1 Tax=Accumulibacter sp. TaxID=2053492 RepID=UPI00287A373F|nr:lipoprotein [Accumulibacter sp.]MDS4053949.1 lipoprotein [Accumulibacter sp.]HMV07141.1 lipoprotein [Accumulibacter sp.]HNB67696.1 lipoprotein [Accumulibacter sp.]HND39457.1 lipoprotein [Accumulibacter sp.]HNG16274.1 lipoprotein [Accumulibacter sp.]
MYRTVYPPSARLLAATLLAILAVAGCGNKGPLKMPPTTRPAASGEAPRTGAAASTPDTNTLPGSAR